MNPVSLAILIVKVALCTLPFIAGLRLVFLSKETLLNFTSRLFGISDLEISTSTHITIKVIGILLIAIAFGLIYLIFWPEPAEKPGTSAFLPVAEQLETSLRG